MVIDAAKSLFYHARDGYDCGSTIGSNVNEGLMIINVAQKVEMTRNMMGIGTWLDSSPSKTKNYQLVEILFNENHTNKQH